MQFKFGTSHRDYIKRQDLFDKPLKKRKKKTKAEKRRIRKRFESQNKNETRLDKEKKT